MMHTLAKSWGTLCLLLLLTACGGEKLQGFTEFTDLRLSQLQVSGGTLMFDGEEVERFDAENTGPYDVVLDDANQATLSITATAEKPAEVRMELVEAGVDEGGVNRVTAFTSGGTQEVTLNPGSNLVYVRVISLSTGATTRYQLLIEKANPSTRLRQLLINGLPIGNVKVGATNVDSGTEMTFTEAVAAGETQLLKNVGYSVCNVAVRPLAESRTARVLVNGEPVMSGSSVFVPLFEQNGSALPEDNLILIEVIPETGEAQQYRVYIEREASTESDRARDARLTSLSADTGYFTEPFRCNKLNRIANNALAPQMIRIAVSNEITTLPITAVTAQAAATMLIIPADYNDSGTLVVSDTGAEVLQSGVSYSGAVVSDLEEGTNVFAIRVEPEDEAEASYYFIEIERSTRRQVYVETGEALQAALRAAEPNDEIIVTPGTYTGLPSESAAETGSGDPQAYFFSDRSGTEETPIVLRSLAERPMLEGTEGSGAVLLKLTGQYWNISGIDFADAESAVFLQGASHINLNLFEASAIRADAVTLQQTQDISLGVFTLADIGADAVVLDATVNTALNAFDIRRVGQRALVLRNAAIDSVIKGGVMTRVGQAYDPAVVTVLPGQAIVVGEGAGVTSNTIISGNVFGRDIANEAIATRATSSGTQILFNIFEGDTTLAQPFSPRSVLQLGADARVEFNEFDLDYYSAGSDLFDSVVAVEAPGAALLIANNVFDIENETLPFVQVADAEQVVVRRNGSEPVYGSGVTDQGDVAQPFALQSTLDESLCFTRRSVTETRTSGDITLDYVILATCDGSDAQRWVWVNDGDGFIQIAAASDTSVKLDYIARAFNVDVDDEEEGVLATGNYLSTRTDDGSSFDAKYTLRWRLDYAADGSVGVVSKFGGQTVVEDSAWAADEVDVRLIPVGVASSSDTLSSRFRVAFF